jgi:hypothetical protein
VAAHKKPGDAVVCIDTIAVKLGSPVSHNHSGSHFGRAEKHYLEMLGRVRAARHGTAWIIRCAPEPDVRQQFIALIRATRCVVLLPSILVAKQRARLRDADSAATTAAIDSWYRRFHAAPFDEVIRG